MLEDTNKFSEEVVEFISNEVATQEPSQTVEEVNDKMAKISKELGLSKDNKEKESIESGERE